MLKHIQVCKFCRKQYNNKYGTSKLLNDHHTAYKNFIYSFLRSRFLLHTHPSTPPPHHQIQPQPYSLPYPIPLPLTLSLIYLRHLPLHVTTIYPQFTQSTFNVANRTIHKELKSLDISKAICLDNESLYPFENSAKLPASLLVTLSTSCLKEERQLKT